jgi:hypothetical protein
VKDAAGVVAEVAVAVAAMASHVQDRKRRARRVHQSMRPSMPTRVATTTIVRHHPAPSQVPKVDRNKSARSASVVARRSRVRTLAKPLVQPLPMAKRAMTQATQQRQLRLDNKSSNSNNRVNSSSAMSAAATIRVAKRKNVRRVDRYYSVAQHAAITTTHQR